MSEKKLKSGIEDLNNASLDIHNAINTVEDFDDPNMQEALRLLKKADGHLDTFIVNNS